MTAFDLVRKRFDSLTRRQREIFELLAEGSTNAQIAGSLGITVHTVKAHRAEVMRRMGAASFADLVSQFQRVRSAGSIPAAARKAPLAVIVVEDDEWYRDYLTENLAERGFAVTGAADGEGFDAAWAIRPADIVILDIGLGTGKEDGLAIAARLRAGATCGVIMLTGRGELDDRIRGLSTGADAYFAKPVSIEELAISIANLGRRLR